MIQDWKEKLQSEIMEEYIFLAEMKQHAKDKTAHMIRMREQWDKLCSFIESLLSEERIKAHALGYKFGYKDGEDSALQDIKTIRNNVLSEVERDVENLDTKNYYEGGSGCIEDISTIIKSLRV